MKIRNKLQHSLSAKFAGLMLRVFLFIVIGALVIAYGYHQLNQYHNNKNDLLEHKEAIIKQIDNRFNQAFLDFRGYFAFENEALKASGYEQEEKIRTLLTEFQEVSNTPADRIFRNNVTEYLTYYYTELVPHSITNFEQGNREEIKQMANQGATKTLSTFQDDIRNYRHEIDNRIESNYELLVQRNSYILIIVGIYLLGIMLILFRMTRIMFKNVGKPLSEFAEVANEIAAGGDADVNIINNREDELGKLSVAFKKMVTSLQEKEQDLLGQNEELIAQQDELEVQQVELESTLSNLRRSENNLKHRNEFVKGISNSLNKQTVLQDIIVNMCKITEADQGIICFLHEENFASYGVSKDGEKQFLQNLDNGQNEKLVRYKESFTVKRELVQEEKGFHEAKSYAYDLYLPILDIEDEVVAMLVLSRYGSPFPEDKFEEYQGFAKQISISLENIQMYDQTEEDRKRNQDILNTVLEGIQLVDVEGKTIQVNHKLCEIFECKNWNKGIVDTSMDSWAQEMENYVQEKDELISFFSRAIEAVDTDETYTYKLINTNKVYQVYANSLFHEGEKIGTIFVHRDITKEAEIDQMKSEFVSTVSHELRTPLASIYGYTELMLNRELKPEKQKKYLSTIYQETKRLTTLINDFLDVQRMEAGKQTYEKKYIDLIEIIEKVMETQQVNMTDHRFEIDVDTSYTTVLGDKDKLEQLFTNLISNAIKYSPDGGKVSIHLYQEEDYIKTEIKDEGLGIPKEALNKLFSKFYRVDNSDRRAIGGTGLGLSIVKEISHAHNGDVFVSTEYGKGSTFTIKLPLVDTISNVTDPIKGTKENEAYKIFIIEDDRSLAGLIEHELRENKFFVRHFTKATEALQQLKDDLPHAIVLDLNLESGEMDGWDFMRELKNKEEPYSDIPIIISSALEEQKKSLELGACDYFLKPYKASDLSRTLLQTLLKKEKNGQIFIPDLINRDHD
ncbi:Sensor histidine kinase YycG [Paraliobacillus sp. PM-2]|uniref:ATP-binding protein n=1 Tax=Paraliobacillus sp. PM-2 TaxID=1462524 RepID=UPI00061CB6CA|nr:ATP-binding protein [Paraliobacillus sp. PM-2]CQR47519.1 Sensor histidine kinase YycG [Paraliobacillus sp. PM-2]